MAMAIIVEVVAVYHLEAADQTCFQPTLLETHIIFCLAGGIVPL